MENKNITCFITDIKKHTIEVEFRDSDNPLKRFHVRSGVPKNLFKPEDINMGQCFYVYMDGDNIRFEPFEKKEWTQEELDDVDKQVEKYMKLFPDNDINNI